jgi:SAM-dependent methyltransferase
VSINKVSMYDVDSHIAEAYDRDWETDTDDVEVIREFIAGQGTLRILEPFCGTGRILLPLLEDGHEVVGIDRCQAFVGRLRDKLSRLPVEARRQATLVEGDVIALRWPIGFDLVVMGGNCLYELGSPEEQEHCIASAAASLKPGAHLFLDNDHMEGELLETWRTSGRHRHPRPFTCEDGTLLEFESETIWYDAPRRLHRSRRYTTVTRPDGSFETIDFIIQKHPPSLAEMRAWLATHGLLVVSADETPERATYWARKER